MLYIWNQVLAQDTDLYHLNAVLYVNYSQRKSIQNDIHVATIYIYIK